MCRSAQMGWRRESAKTSLTDEELWLRAVIAEIGGRVLVRLVDASQGHPRLVEVPASGHPADVLVLRTAS